MDYCRFRMVEPVRTNVTEVHSDGIFSPFGHLPFGPNATVLKLPLTGSRDLMWRFVQQNYFFINPTWTKLTVVIYVKCAKVFLIT